MVSRTGSLTWGFAGRGGGLRLIMCSDQGARDHDEGPSRLDPATGQTYVRALATPEQVLELFNWGPSGADQLTAVHRERARLRLPRAPRQPLTLITDNGNIT